MSFVKTKMLNALSENPEQDISGLYDQMTKSKPEYEGYDWFPVKKQIIDSVESTVLGADNAGVKKASTKKPGKDKPKAKHAEEKKPAEAEPETFMSENLPTKVKTKKGVEYEIDAESKEIIIEGDTKAAIKCKPGQTAYKRQIAEKKAGFGCQSNKKGSI